MAPSNLAKFQHVTELGLFGFDVEMRGVIHSAQLK
jgi:hypothetical protein